MQAFNDMWWWDADGGNEYLGAGVDGHGYEVVELAVRVVVVCLAGAAADLGECEVNAEGEGFVV